MTRTRLLGGLLVSASLGAGLGWVFNLWRGIPATGEKTQGPVPTNGRVDVSSPVLSHRNSGWAAALSPSASPSTDESAPHGGLPASGERVQASVRAASPINEILDLWDAGRKDLAVAAFLALAESGADAQAYRPYHLTEQQFVALASNERERLIADEFLPRQKLLRQLVRTLVDEIAPEAIASGNREKARAILTGVKRLGTANTGPEVMLVIHYMGRAIKELAERKLAELTLLPPE